MKEATQRMILVCDNSLIQGAEEFKCPPDEILIIDAEKHPVARARILADKRYLFFDGPERIHFDVEAIGNINIQSLLSLNESKEEYGIFCRGKIRKFLQCELEISSQ